MKNVIFVIYYFVDFNPSPKKNQQQNKTKQKQKKPDAKWGKFIADIHPVQQISTTPVRGHKLHMKMQITKFELNQSPLVLAQVSYCGRYKTVIS